MFIGKTDHVLDTQDTIHKQNPSKDIDRTFVEIIPGLGHRLSHTKQDTIGSLINSSVRVR